MDSSFAIPALAQNQISRNPAFMIHHTIPLEAHGGYDGIRATLTNMPDERTCDREHSLNARGDFLGYRLGWRNPDSPEMPIVFQLTIEV